jgi:hypothetical protein
MKLQKKLSSVKPAAVRHLIARNTQPYERILKYVRNRDDIWVASQGEYIDWWQQRENACLKITVSQGTCQAQTALDKVVIEKYPDEFLDTPTVSCPEAIFSGEVWVTIDRTIERKDILISILKREGILNFRVADDGEFMLSQAEMTPLLEKIEANLHQRKGSFLEDDIRAIREIVLAKLAVYRIPLLRIWYHPRLNGVVVRAVFSARHDIDRAITNLSYIRALEQKYDAPSTLYIRAFCPFYGDREIKALAAQPWCSEIALHGEFVTNARRYGDEIKAAIREKQYLEKLTGQPVLGVGMHGGELAYNRSDQTEEAIQQAGLLYDTTLRPGNYFFPFRKITGDKCFSNAYTLAHALSDVNIPVNRDYGSVFYQRAIAQMNEIYEQNGIFVLMLHPEYFGFFKYLAYPRNWKPLVSFFWRYFRPNHSEVESRYG